MKSPTLTRALLLAATMIGMSAVATHPAQAGFFDFLFGGGSQPPAPRYQVQPSWDGPPLGVRVNPRRKKEAVSRSGTSKESARKGAVQTAINPVSHPNWHLEDPTLRRGDIVVLKTGVMVYDGGPRPQAREDFTTLSKSGLVSRTERERIAKMAGPPQSPEDPATQGKAASLEIPSGR